ncbi:hypothetical protein [Veillonella intestinalis]|uniref:hypothetical protein n=1 Tax=Veillonella intestinalis TaxID=2941341 RepID=UPI00203C75C9|nr:hypothetical protein [Veillonella intestinalis]
MGRMSDRALRDYAYKVLKSEYGERVNNGVVIPAKYTDEQLAGFVANMPQWQLDDMYRMMYGSEMVE